MVRTNYPKTNSLLPFMQEIFAMEVYQTKYIKYMDLTNYGKQEPL